MRKRAFTLIELLVVIAIIAILAAILFPVFAQAKVAAKKAQDLSNTKQIALCTNIYTTDTDDVMPIFFTNIVGGVCLPTNPTTCGYRSMWQYMVYPYIKNWDMMTAPQDTKTGDPVADAFLISYGYNYGYLSTLCVAGDSYSQTRLGCPAADPGNAGAGQFYLGISSTSVNRPANIVMYADGGGKDFSAATTLGSVVNPPDAWPAEKYFYGPNGVGWGLNCDNYFKKGNSGGAPQPKTGAWGNTDGFAPRYSDVGNVVFVDSHARSSRVGAMASGTTWTPTRPCDNDQMLVNDYNKYQWDPRYDSGTQRHF
ncbi:MAG: prepilin-type N-terminal cleavage/methylation domain-containing protein [Armatimonadetes bacterium]|nr:prepilin-type N-terminal cleavage/methylation domain-containing protein [Armatimonadota bacterium]